MSKDKIYHLNTCIIHLFKTIVSMAREKCRKIILLVTPPPVLFRAGYQRQAGQSKTPGTFGTTREL
jgi:hypothetical protein